MAQGNINTKGFTLSISRYKFRIPPRTAKLLYVSSKKPNDPDFGDTMHMNFDPVTDELTRKHPPTTDPSTIFVRLPVSKPSNPGQVIEPAYYPTYFESTPKQRWIYLNWLQDISQPVNISYVFLYYYGLERQLLTGNFDLAVDEILFLREHHYHGSFYGYSSSALFHSCIAKKSFKTLSKIYEHERFPLSRNQKFPGLTTPKARQETCETDRGDYIKRRLLVAQAIQQGYGLVPPLGKNCSISHGDINIRLLLTHREGHGLSATTLVELAQLGIIPTKDKRLFKQHPELCQSALQKVLSINFGEPIFPLVDNYDIRNVPTKETRPFANGSLPSDFVSEPGFITYDEFLDDVSEILNGALQNVKLAVRKKPGRPKKVK